MPLYRETIHALLMAEVEQAKKRFASATKEFREVMSDVPAGLPHPDGVTRIQNASNEWKSASDAYQRALQRFHSFILDEMVPEEFRERKQ